MRAANATASLSSAPASRSTLTSSSVSSSVGARPGLGLGGTGPGHKVVPTEDDAVEPLAGQFLFDGHLAGQVADEHAGPPLDLAPLRTGVTHHDVRGDERGELGEAASRR